ncbi:MAG: hypothetical protein HYU77_13910 [Betaproteobacteria bacterium]|nr:hypothetical protein [Betaproteobacteria bacterium]
MTPLEFITSWQFWLAVGVVQVMIWLYAWYIYHRYYLGDWPTRQSRETTKDD